MRLFDSIPVRKPRRNKFDLSHQRKFSLEFGKLVPCLVLDCLPGDVHRLHSTAMLRMMPTIAPVMHRFSVYIHYWFVPDRLVWNESELFHTGGKDGTSEPVWPHIPFDINSAEYWAEHGSLADYMGIPTPGDPLTVANERPISAIPFRAYQMIYNEWYRDQNLSDPIEFVKSSGAVLAGEFPALLTMRNRAWKKDRYTSALPEPQRGVAVQMPVEGEVNIEYKDISDVYDQSGNAPAAETLVGNGPAPGAASQLFVGKTGTGANGETGRIENIERAFMTAASTTLNDFRIANSLQMFLEKMMRGGARYAEYVWNVFGTHTSDSRLDRPEFLGGGRGRMGITPVLSTFQAEDGEIPQGNMSGQISALSDRNGFRYKVKEHGTIIGIMSLLPEACYQQGIPKMFDRRERFDYAVPDLANIGEEPIKNAELFVDWESAYSPDDDAGFGYTPRYSDYKFMPSTVHGDFRDTLAYWHAGRIFDVRPELNMSFVEMKQEEIARIWPVVSGPGAAQKVYCQLDNKLDSLRPLPYFGVPHL